MPLPNKGVAITITWYCTLLILVGFNFYQSKVEAAPPPANAPAFAGVSALTFTPVDYATDFQVDTARHLLRLTEANRAPYFFMAPLTLPDKNLLTGMRVFGEDFDPQGAVQVRLMRCDHGQARCVSLGTLTSTTGFAAGLFDTGQLAALNEPVDNSLYSYFLELELSALLNSGLRSVRLELAAQTNAGLPQDPAQWALEGSATNFTLPEVGWAQVRVCTNDLSHLDNPTHYPALVVDGSVRALASNSCVSAWGRTFEIKRRPNTGPSAGTYQYLP
jgi:hypothetical protein